MSDGQLRCCGSSLFLKKTYGVGYQLTIEKSQNRTVTTAPALTESKHSRDKDDSDGVVVDAAPVDNANNGLTISESLHLHDDTLKRIVKDAVPEASLLNNVGTEMSFQLPLGAASKFGPMFEGLDAEIDKKTISTYGVGITTLDEVFILVARGNSAEKPVGLASSSNVAGSGSGDVLTDGKAEKSQNSSRSRMDLEKEKLFTTHLSALLRKRVANFRRDRKAQCCTTILPSLFVLIGFIIFKFASPTRNLDPILLTLDDYNPSISSGIRNPIAVNADNNPYTCQPGFCAYQAPTINVTNEGVYTYCGVEAYLGLGELCSITESEQIISTLDGTYGAKDVPTTVSDVFNSSESLFVSSHEYVASQYGAVFFTHDSASVIDGTNSFYNTSAIQQCHATGDIYTSPEDCVRYGGYGHVIQYNFTALHVTPLFQALADEALVRQARGWTDFTVQTTVAPLPITKLEQGYGQAEDAFSAWFLVVLSFPFIAGAFATFVVQERQSKAKHLQTVAGVEPSAYWLSTVLWDTMNYQIPLWITVVLMFAFNVTVLTTTDKNIVGGIITVLVLFGPAAAGFSYCVSYAFDSPSLANLFLIIFSFLIGMGGPLGILILTIIGKDLNNPKPQLVNAATAIKWVLRPLPPFCLGQGIYTAINIDTYEYFEGRPLTAWTKPILLIEVIFLAAECVAYPLLAIYLDKWSSNPRMMNIYRKFVAFITCRCFSASKIGGSDDITTALPDDDDVLAEQDRVLQGHANDDLIVLNQLTKIYENGKVAVNNLSLGIAAGECFGLLGINGAGKTTTMQMLTAEFPPTSGDATLAGFSVSNEPEKTRRRIGYCPQFDAHFANMTGREHVELYAAIKGIPKEFVKESAALKLKEVGLSETDADRVSSKYSGGMKRRLSLACATIGQPQIVFLDEASTGVDPVAQREIWQLVSDMVTNGDVPPQERTSVILTTHSMTECEALCRRIGIMANGRLRCLGSAQHLKNKFGQGFQIEMKVNLLDRQDESYLRIAALLAKSKAGLNDEEALSTSDDIVFNLEEAKAALRSLTEDEFLVNMVNEHDPAGYNVFKNASAGVETLSELAAFATTELRMRKVESFVQQNFANSILRERQDTKARYEVPSENLRIATIFAKIEDSKDELMLSDYGVSQTSLEQVFNMHAAEAEKLKQGRDDH